MLDSKGNCRVWLVLDGDVLFVDRNGNGDLTEAGERIAAAEASHGTGKGYSFEVGELSCGGRRHKGLNVHVIPLSVLAENPTLARSVHLKAAIKADAESPALSLTIDIDGREDKRNTQPTQRSFLVGPIDHHGVLQFGARPKVAPRINLGGSLQIAFYGTPPTLRLGRDNDLVLTVGVPGHGPGTFAMLAYEGVIPDDVHPQVEIAWPASASAGTPVKEHYHLKERC